MPEYSTLPDFGLFPELDAYESNLLHQAQLLDAMAALDREIASLRFLLADRVVRIVSSLWHTFLYILQRLRRTKQNYNNSPDDLERLEADIETAEQEVEVLEHDMRMRETMMTKLRIEWDWLSDRARMSRER